MHRMTRFFVLLPLLLLVTVSACREDTHPPDRFNENLAQAGQPALLPLTPHEYAGDVRGRLVRMDREEREAGGPAGDGSAAAASPDAEAVMGLIDDFNRLVRGGDFASVSELVVAEQREAALTYWSQLGELSLAMRHALSQTTEAVGATRPDLMPRVESLTETIDQITVRGIVSPRIELSGDEAVVLVDSPAPPGLVLGDRDELTLRRGPDGWRFAAAVPGDGNAETWTAPVRAALAETESTVDAFDSAQIDVEALVSRLTTAATAVLAGETPNPADDEPAPAEEDAPPPAPPAPPATGGGGGLVP